MSTSWKDAIRRPSNERVPAWCRYDIMLHPHSERSVMFRPRTFLPVLLTIVFPFLLSAQQREYSGTVVDPDGRPVAGAHVRLLDSHRGAVTDADGRFRFLAPLSAATRIEVTHLGFAPVTRELRDSGTAVSLDLVLSPVPVDLGAVMVTATRIEDLLRDIPQPVGIVPSAAIQRSPAVSVPDALDAEPGITLVRDGVWGTDVSIRGLGRANVVTLVDGARIETATNHAAGLSMVDVNDIERIEVIRGAASTLYGTGATGGVVNILTGEGVFGDGFRLHGSLSGNYSSVNDGAATSAAVNAVDSRWFLRLRGTLRSARDAETPDGVLRDSRFHDRSLSASAGARIDGSQEVRVRYQLFDARDVGIPGGSSFPDQATARYPDERRELVQGEYRVDQISESFSRLSLRVSHQRIDRNVELVPNAAVTLRPSAEHEMNAALLQGNWRLASEALGEHQFVVGIDAWQRDYQGRRLREVKATGAVIADLPLPNASFRSVGLFAHDAWSLPGDRLRLSLGARLDQIHVANEESYDLLFIEQNGVRNDAPPNRSLRWAAASSDELSWSLAAGLLYALRPDLDLTLNASRAYRAPSLEERFQYIELGGAVYLGDIDLAAERGSCFDIGMRLRRERFSLTGNVFVNLMGDLVVDERRSDTLYVKANVGEAMLYGGELSLEYNPFDAVTLSGQLSYVRGRDTGTNEDLPQIPPLSARVGVALPLPGVGRFETLIDLAADQERVAPDESPTPGHALLHLRLRSASFRFAGVAANVAAGVDNVFDRPWRRHLSTLRGLVVAEPGRNIFVRLNLLF